MQHSLLNKLTIKQSVVDLVYISLYTVHTAEPMYIILELRKRMATISAVSSEILINLTQSACMTKENVTSGSV